MDGRCFFAAEPPRVVVRGDLIFIIPEGCRCEIALTAHTLTEFIGEAQRALADFHVRANAVVEFRREH